MKYPLLAITAFLLAACGGSDGDNNAPKDPIPHVADKHIERLDADTGEDYQYVQLDINGRTFITASADTLQYVLDPNVVPIGLQSAETQITFRDPQGRTHRKTSPIHSYRGFYGGVYVTNPVLPAKPGDPATFATPWYKPTAAAQLPNAGKATYGGYAIGLQADNTANFFYDVDFGSKRGSGRVEGNAYHPAITLHADRLERFSENGLSGFEFDGSASVSGSSRGGSYELVLSGDQAQEIAGYLNYQDSKTGREQELGLFGARGEIKP